ncbi:MAG: histidine kinase, partial [Romboutsia sp.]
MKIIKRNHYFEIILLVSFACDYISSINWLIYGNDNGMFKNFFIFLIFSFIIATTIYLVQLKNKIYEIQILNSSINLKNNELRAIKHDYGSQISYLYALHLM